MIDAGSSTEAKVLSWGKGEDGQLGRGDGSDVSEPNVIPALNGKNPTSIHGGAEYSVAICSNGAEVYSWGWCASTSSTSWGHSSAHWALPGAQPRRVCCSAPGAHRECNHVACRVCCRGDFGRLGHGHGNDVLVPRQIMSLSGKVVTSISCGDSHTLVLLDTGKLMAFGRNQNGQIGNGTHIDCFDMCAVQGLGDHRIVGTACGAEHSVCVTDDGSVYAWCAPICRR